LSFAADVAHSSDNILATMTSPSALSPSRIRVGIGSWTDKEYTGVIFPPGVRSDERLKVYATRFNHVEVNSSYHALPRRAWVESWVKQTPPEFTFGFKLPRRFSDSPTKAAADEPLMGAVLGVTEPLVKAGKLGTFFLITPPRFGPGKHALEELDDVVKKLQPHTLAVEMRHSGWIAEGQRERTFEYFRARKIAWIAVDMPSIEGSTIMPVVDEVTNPQLAYLRLHGRNQNWLNAESATERHTYMYNAKELDEIANRVRLLATKAETVHVIANNHAEDFAPKTALALQKLLGLEMTTAVDVEKTDGIDELPLFGASDQK
jgi:uncharacterized protein YecE (DUF72 family)